jgi:hypothetical protein
VAVHPLPTTTAHARSSCSHSASVVRRRFVDDAHVAAVRARDHSDQAETEAAIAHGSVGIIALREFVDDGLAQAGSHAGPLVGDREGHEVSRLCRLDDETTRRRPANVPAHGESRFR